MKNLRIRSSGDKANENYPIVVHSHLRWDWVWQRPQQFVSRLSRRHRVLFIETLAPDPQLASPLARFRTLEDFPNLTVLSLQFPAWRWQDAAYVDAERRRLVLEFIKGPVAGQFERPVQWFYDPMTAPIFIGRLGERLTVYDCMDELSKFQGAPPEIRQREQQLLAQADVVFTGGRKLFQAKSRLHPNCHFYGCGVDATHFGRAHQEATQLPQELAQLPKPVLGYFGVIDERLDYQLIDALAEANPEQSVVMIGPVLKVDERVLPRRANVHWLGQRPYADLPAFCKGFDVCLMPFALNEATEYINPTKALEYMATGRPIVSTAVADVVHNFGQVVQIARDRGEFLSMCQRAVLDPDCSAINLGLKMARENSWDSIVERLEGHVTEALQPAVART
ncbi:MAG TPA: glycosyltransferase [Candidatus Limnocylindrales bacterium]|nr:glycosyltransferase [Candidatus Limnocylindrales bacterium]